MKNKKSILLYVLILLVFFACSPMQRIQRIYSKHPELRPHDSVKVEIKEKERIVYRDTTISISLPADTVYEQGEVVYLPGEKVYIKTVPEIVIAESEYAKARAWIEPSGRSMYLKLLLTDKDTTLYFKLDDALKEARYWYTEYEKKTTIVPEPYIPSFVRILAWFGAGVFILGIVAILWKFLVLPRIR